MRKLFLSHTTEYVLFAVIIAISVVLAFMTDRFFTLGNVLDLLNISA
ncbi:ABC transporter permease, partial [Rhizobium ruizarguesonis]